MAKVCGATVGIFIILLINNCCVSADNEESHGSSGSSIYDLSQLPGLPSTITFNSSPRERRDTPIEQVKSSSTSLYSTLPDNSTLAAAGTAPPSQAPEINAPKPAIPVAPVSSTASPVVGDTPVIKEQQLLGVNGTGQRKVMSTPKPVVSEPIQPTTKTVLTTKKDYSWINSELDEFLDNVDMADNDTIKAVENQNYTVNYTTAHHQYYNSTIFVDKDEATAYWEAFKNISRHPMLSTSHRRAMTVQLSFDFPFYGNPIRNVTVATGGFLYTGEYVHSWLAATQYIAPLMANFDTSISNDSQVRYSDNGTAFTVIWENVYLQDRQEVGKFSFSTTLHKTGDIVFTYFSVPIRIEAIQDDKHPVKVGLSDAYIIDKVVIFSRRKTIYEYHRVNFGSNDIQNSTIIRLVALPTCLDFTDCNSCVNHNTSFPCVWCPTLNRCSTGTERRRQDWLHKGCDRVQIAQQSTCPALGTKGNNAGHPESDETTEPVDTILHDSTNLSPNHYDKTKNGEVLPSKAVSPLQASIEPSKPDAETSHAGWVFGFLVPLCLVATILVWVLYAYRNPHTKSGQLLIQYRPSQWSWRRGEARYTAATIHM